MPCKVWGVSVGDQVLHLVHGGLQCMAHQLAQHRLHFVILAGIRLLKRLMCQRGVVPLR